MKISLYAPCWNDAPMIPYFLRHYEDVVDRIFIYDDGSTDRSLELLGASPKVEVRTFEHRSDAHCFDSRNLWEHAWKPDREEADWVITCNLDEHAFHSDLRGYLESCLAKGITVIPSPGYDMIAQEFPAFSGRLCDRILRGAPTAITSKTMIFKPKEIETMNFTPGRHKAAPVGKVVIPADPQVRILHYKYIGFEYVRERHAELAARMRPGDRERRMGNHYDRSEEELREFFGKLESDAIYVPDDPILPRLQGYNHMKTVVRAQAC